MSCHRHRILLDFLGCAHYFDWCHRGLLSFAAMQIVNAWKQLGRTAQEGETILLIYRQELQSMLSRSGIFSTVKNNYRRVNGAMLFMVAVASFSCSPGKSTAPDAATPAVAAPTASTVVLAMGTGFNLGNTFDLQANSTNPDNIRPIIDLYYSAGMRHIRIPVTWMQNFSDNLANANGVVNFQNPRFIQLDAVIQYALSKNMYVVLNTHHELWLKNNYDGSAQADSVFTTLWRGIATHFRDYSDHLIFDVLNEPEGAMGTFGGAIAPSNAQALALTRQINNVGYKAIRATGGGNSTRIVMVEPNGQGNQSQLVQVYPTKANLPGGGTDQYLAMQVHTYDPWAFCGQTGKNSAWPGASSITSPIDAVASHAQLLGVPVNYGEFGVGRTTDSDRNVDVVREYYRTVRLAALGHNMSATVWDDRGWFGLVAVNGSTMDFLYYLVPSMMAP
jgi:endoglucanase